MNYWITTHWPPREGEVTTTSSQIYLPDGREEAGKNIAKDDLVLVYESRTGRTLFRKSVDGSEQRVKCTIGREGLILIGKVMSPLHADQDSKPDFYVDGTTIWWRWYAPLEILSRSGFVSQKDVNHILGYKLTYNFRGFGDLHSGLKKITKAEYKKLTELFYNRNPLTLPVYPQKKGTRTSGGGTGIESKEHLDLKEYIAHNPSLVLREGGLNTLGIEYKFQTGDRADLVLSDHANRVIGGEVEVEIEKEQWEGPLQAIKYRYMLELITKRAPGDSRAILAAYRIHPSVAKSCKKYNVECHEVSRDEVIAWRKNNPRSKKP